MPRNGSGDFSFTDADFVAGTTISVTPMNSRFAEIAVALSASIAKDGQTTPTADLPMGNQKHTGVANASARNHYAAAGQVQDGALSYAGTAVYTTTSNVYALTLSPAITAYASGQSFLFYASNTSVGSNAEANVNAVSKKAILTADGRTLRGGEIKAGTLNRITYDGAAFRLPPVPGIEFLETIDASGASSVVFNLPSNYTAFEVYFDNVRGGAPGAGESLICYFSSNNGSSYTSNYGQTFARGPVGDATATSWTTASQSFVFLTYQGVPASNVAANVSGKVLIYPGTTGGFFGSLFSRAQGMVLSTTPPTVHDGTARLAVGPVNNVKFQLLANDIHGRFTLAGVRR